MQTANWISWFVPLFLAAGCAQPPAPEPKQVVDVAAEAERIMDLERSWSERYGAGDIDGVMAMIAKDSLLLAPGQPAVVGWDAVRSGTEEMLQAEGVEVSWEPTAAFVAPSGEMAYDYGVATTKLPDGTVQSGSYLVVWVKENGEWKVAADMFH